ncbi:MULTISPECIES: hypothetical protein [Duncaniella]|jgi:cytochrome c-type biogenesis protein CcmH/NrfF|uniref:Uncharacterized protein n=1 Tax=Duncaniella dubosii TaxID=2518971 RepID=A0A4V1D387_9BACT|nr:MULTISPECIES: hypothetical protein [Duncaniella]MBJ2190538.1 hypothetical protein [Muribaculaceae bacterium]MCX4284931.1 hypothetical protein [Duncaniella dubosii]QCD42148.1 hypothetical protein E7747_07600 [Duncaniella dubosii]HBN63066.1 hypothetical protein [Porphyromonadaceae bacterium]
MAPLDERTLLLWLGIVLLVIIVTITGLLINRYITYRAHRRALESLRHERMASLPRISGR